MKQRLAAAAAAAAAWIVSAALGQHAGPMERSAALLPATAPAARAPERTLRGAFRDERDALTMDLPAIRQAANGRGAFLIKDFPIESGRVVDLEVERFRVATRRTRFVVGSERSAEGPLRFDPESVVLLRGRVAGAPRSHVFLALADSMTNGVIDLGPGRGSYGVSSRRGGGGDHAPGQLSVFRSAGGGRAAAALCMVNETGVRLPGVPSAPDGDPRRGLRQIELAVETDYEWFGLFGDENAAMTYIVQLYGAVSDIFMDNINVRVDLSFARVWTAPQPFQAGLGGFQAYWGGNMQSVHRDVAQMFSGRPDLPGGVAYLNSVCSGYSFCGNAVGFFVDVELSNIWSYDPLVAAHELGHNFGTHHTDFYGLDNCNIVGVTPQRGTIMSYCSQTVSGGMSVMDMSFHKVTQGKMRQYLANVTVPACVVYDCNQNGVSDAVDISGGAAQDANGNGIPDECEDCNGNGVLDPQDIASGTSQDQNASGVPDECEPDCNGNGVPDDLDISSGFSQDAHGDNVPDECDADLNQNGQSDYNEIMADMPLDKDRDRALDAKQDCDGDTVPDLEELDGAWDVWAGSLGSGGVLRRFHAEAGVLMRVSDAGAPQVYDLIITPDRRVLASSITTHKIVEYDHRGVFVRDLVAAGAGSLTGPAGMVVSPAGTLIVASRTNNRVLEFDLSTGVYIRDFVAPGSGGLGAPFGVAFGPDGLFYVTSNDNRVLRYHGSTGAFVDVFVASGTGGLQGPRGICFKPDGNLLVASFNTSDVLEYSGATGAFIQNWAKTGVAFTGPWCIRMGPKGNVFVSANGVGDSHVTRARIHEFDVDNGYWQRGYVLGNDTGLTQTTGFDFVPDAGTDCNDNQRPDNCDIASGFSQDVNGNGVPDECEEVCYPDCNADGALNLADFGCFQTSFALGRAYADCNGDGVRNLADFGCFQTSFALGCP